MSSVNADDIFAIMEPLSSLKRKRCSEKCEEAQNTDAKTGGASCFTNAAFSSTPKKLTARRRRIGSKEPSKHAFVNNDCMEVKSIADIVLEAKPVSKALEEPMSRNPYEVIRKPPKKKKREAEIVEACFENPALNLELPEKQFNPYEILREPCISTNTPSLNGFTNPALNLRTKDEGATRNPFEIQRCSAASAIAANPAGVENMGLVEVAPTELKIELPFQPTLGCRIDFSNMSLSQLTPSKLLAEKLVFSPAPGPKRSWGSISEESTMDIGKELDRYQLELENSINEAKLRRNCNAAIDEKVEETIPRLSLEIEKTTAQNRLEEIIEEVEEEEEQQQPIKENEIIEQRTEIEISTKQVVKLKCVTGNVINAIEKENLALSQVDNCADVAYASDSDDDFDFKTPAPFLRAYQRPPVPKLTVSRESLHSTGSAEFVEHKKTLNVGGIIRKSIRKLMHHGHDCGENRSQNAKETDENDEPKTHVNAYKFLRNSLRRQKTNKQHSDKEQMAEVEISIIDTSERNTKLKAEVPVLERKHTLRSSLRRSTREVMKSVFHRTQHAYDLTQ